MAEDTTRGGASPDGGDAGGGDSQRLEQRLNGLLQENARLSEENEGLRGENTELLEENEGLKGSNTELTGKVTELKESLGAEKERHRAEWRRTCQPFFEYDDLLAEKEQTILDLQRQLEVLKRNRSRGGGSVEEKGLPTEGELRDSSPIERSTPLSEHSPTSRLKHDLVGRKRDLTTRGYTDHSKVGSPMSAPARRGKAPPIDQFSGKSSDVMFDDWLPALERAAN